MKPFDISKLLPEPNGEEYERIKKDNPYFILINYAKAIEQKYPKKLTGLVAESEDFSKAGRISYAFFILAAIGNGYSYRLLELTQSTNNTYPLNVYLFKDKKLNLGKVNNAKDLESKMQEIVSSNFMHSLILNLLAQIDLQIQNRHVKNPLF